MVHSVCLDQHGNVWTFGSNLDKQLGFLEGGNVQEPKQIPDLPVISRTF